MYSSSAKLQNKNERWKAIRRMFAHARVDFPEPDSPNGEEEKVDTQLRTRVFTSEPDSRTAVGSTLSQGHGSLFPCELRVGEDDIA